MSYSEERLECQQLFDYCLLAQQLVTDMATNRADTQHNQFFDKNGSPSDWKRFSHALPQHMTQLIQLNHTINESIVASVHTDNYIRQLNAGSDDSDDQTLINTNISDIFDEKLQQTSAQRDTNHEDDDNYKKLMEVLNEFNADSMDNGSDDEDMIISDTQQNQIPIDPFSKQEISRPVKNKKCGHIYDREQLRLVLESRVGSGGHPPSVRCPTVGCNNKSVTLGDVVDDRKTLLLINKMKANDN